MSGMLAAALLLAWIPLLSAQNSHSTKEYSLSIPQCPLSIALDEFSKQTGLQIAAEIKTQQVRDLQVGPIVGKMTPDAALEQLLAGSGLTFIWQNDSTIRIYSEIREPRAEDGVGEVLVTGTRLSGGEGPAPIRVLGRGRMERLGVSTLPGITRYLTQQPFSFSDGHQQTGAQYFQMRGLGFDTTLVLINGRRTSASANSISLNAFDLNTIPLTAIDRIEVMSDSASAIYGADAIGGVVNIILKKEIKDPEVYLHYGGAEGGATERRVAASLGHSFGRLNASLILDFFEHDPLIGNDREMWRNQDFTRFGGQDYRVTNANPGNVYSLTGRPLPGLLSSQAGIPYGSSGIGLTPADFLATAGGRNVDSPYRYRTLSAAMDRGTAFFPVEFQVTPTLSFFGELLLAESKSVTQRSLPSLTRATVPAINPFNPFGEAVAVDYLFVGMDPIEQETESDLVRAVSGARGSFSRWEWEVAAIRSKENVVISTLNGLDQTRVQAAINSRAPESALNLFGYGPAGNDELLNSLVGEPQSFSFSSGNTQLSGFIRGPLFKLAGRASEFVLGAEWRRETAEFFEAEYVAEGRDISSAFAELKVPILDNLSLSLALRGDHYKDTKDSSNPQYGVVWHPARDWLLRASYGTSFRPPSLFELYMPRREFTMPVADPLRGGTPVNLRLLAGGNPNLDVVTARSFTSGFVFTPSNWPGLQFSSTYWRVVMDDRIVVPPFNEILKFEDGFLDRVIRSEPTAEDILAGRPGTLQSVDLTRMNFGRLETSGVDFDVSYLVETQFGCFNPALTATWVHDYSSKDISEAFPINRIGIATTLGTIPEWRVVGALAWKRNGLGASATATYIPSYQDSNLIGPIDRRLPSRTLLDLQASLELGAVFGESSLFSQAKLTAGVLNLFDKAPDFAEAGFAAGYDLSQADMTQRFTYLRLSKSF
jgi:iron complex outermembrane receptor protein